MFNKREFAIVNFCVWARSVYLTTLILGRLSPLSQKLTTVLFESAEERMTVESISWSIFTKGWVEPTTSWSPVGRASNSATEAGAIVSSLRFISRTNFILSWDEHKKSFITSGSVSYSSKKESYLLCIGLNKSDWTGIYHRRIIDVSLITIFITRTYLYNVEPLEPHFYTVKLGFTGVYIIFLFLLKNIDCGYSLELPLRGGSNEYPLSMFWAEIWKISEFLSENFQFWW